MDSLERLARMEAEVNALKESLDEHKEQSKEKFEEVNKKLDDLLALRNKGAGVFWFISLIIGSAGMYGLYNLFHWIGGK